jgi:hypothetical protein
MIPAFRLLPHRLSKLALLSRGDPSDFPRSAGKNLENQIGWV